ncbi:DUF3094 family protein [Parahaliea mediterranea]|uniref:DUF3094 family protein n=1 Tax=Parahaliea mediterranea TaxID=651086 RepID=A0A939DGU6_9GAMM|nr:DUF3094 family protein [Parahaliea mediterranea]
MAEKPVKAETANVDVDDENRLYPEDQAKVDAYLKRGVNSVERKPFRPLRLLIMLVVVVMGLSLFSQVLARWAGVY